MDNQVINLKSRTWENKRDFLKKQNKLNKFTCHFCNQRVSLHWGSIRVPHFKHERNVDCFLENESKEHEEGKVLLFHYFEKYYRDVAEEIDMEHRIDETNQVADVYLRFKNGQEWAIEYQRSSITDEDVKKRRKLYRDADIIDIWIIGENLLQKENLLYQVTAIGQSLMEPSTFGVNSLVSLNPHTKEIMIFREGEAVNHRIFSGKDTRYLLEDICFNLKGECFGVEDLTPYIENKKNYGIESMQITIPNTTLKKSPLPGYDFKVDLDDFKQHISVPRYLYPFVPKTCSQVMVDGEIIFNDRLITEVGHFYASLLYPASWEKEINRKKKQQPIIDYLTWGHLEWCLYEFLYDSKSERHRLLADGMHITTAKRRKFELRKRGILPEDHDINEPINIGEFFSILLKAFNLFNPEEDSTRKAIKVELVNEEEISFLKTGHFPTVVKLGVRIKNQMLTNCDKFTNS